MSTAPDSDPVQFLEDELNRTTTETCDHPGCQSAWGPADVQRVLSGSRYLTHLETERAVPEQQ